MTEQNTMKEITKELVFIRGRYGHATYNEAAPINTEKTMSTMNAKSIAQKNVAARRAALLPSANSAMQVLDRMLADLRKAKTYQDIEKLMAGAGAIKVIFKEVDDVRLHAGRVIVLASHRIGLELLKAPKAPAGRPKKIGNTVLPISKDATLAELTGYKMKGHRLKKLAEIDPHPEQIKITKLIDDLVEERVDNITVGATIKFHAGLITKAKRAKSRNAAPLADGMELRIGDCRKVLDDVPDNSVPLILTDPPYKDEAEPLYRWLAEWSARVLIPGGSLICYTGHWSLDRDTKIFGEHLRYWWVLAMMHHQSQRLPGKFIIANFKPVLWYVKEYRRGRTLVPDVLRPPKREKEDHDWGQGEGGVTQLIEHLTEPGELIVDPFAGTATWGRIAASMGRRWLGADIAEGGTTTVVNKWEADDLGSDLSAWYRRVISRHVALKWKADKSQPMFKRRKVA